MITSRVIARVILTTIGIVAALYFLYLVRSVLGLLLIAVFVAVALGRPVDFLSHRGLPRAASILAIYLVMVLAVFGVGLIMVPPAVEGVDELARNLPSYVEELRRSETIREYDDRYGVTARLQEQAERAPQRLVGALAALQSVTVGVFSTLFQLLTILVMAFILLLDGTFFTDFFFRQLGPRRERRARVVADNVYRAVSGYVVGAFAIALIAGLSTFVALLLIGVPYAVPLALLMAFFDLIPLVGATIAGVFIAIVAAFDDFPTDLIAWLVFLIVYQQIENSVVQPFVQRRAVALHPLLVIVAVLIGSSLLGVLGALLAIPAAASIQILVKEYWSFREDPASPTPADQTGMGLDAEPLPEISGAQPRAERRQAEDAEARVHAKQGTEL